MITQQQYDELEAERDALAAKVAEMTVYEWREIGGGDWCVCDESWFNHCQNDPTLDTRKRIKGVNEIRAEAGRAGFVEGTYYVCDPEDDEWLRANMEKGADEYAAKVRQGAE